MERFVFLVGFLFLSIFTFSANASIIVANDWASATVQTRDQKGGVIQTTNTAEGAASIDISVASQRGDYASAKINQTLNPGTLIDTMVVTDDTYTEVEGWLRTSWSFTVSDASVDFRIRLFVDMGGECSSGFLLYDITDGSSVSYEEIYGIGVVHSTGTLLVGHEYVFNASLSRVDMDDSSDLVYDGTSGLGFSELSAADIFRPLWM